MVCSGNTLVFTVYDLLVLCVPCEQRHLVSPRKMFLCPGTTNPSLSLKFTFSLKTSDRGCILCGRLGKQIC